MVERVREAADDPSNRRRVHAVMIAIPPKGVAADELIRDPASAVVKSRIQDGHDIGVVEARHRPGLPKKSLHHALTGVGALEYLDGHVAIQPGIISTEDLAEPSIT
jgi:hypothetical protein